MVVSILDYTSGQVLIYHNVPEGKEEEFVHERFNDSEVEWMSSKEGDFELVESYNPVDLQ